MQENSVILTPNRRLARYLQKQLNTVNAHQNKTTWRSLKILPFSTWLAECWQRSSDSRVLLNVHQERLLWRQIIGQVLGKEFINLTDLIMKTHSLLVNWQLDDTLWSDETEDIAAFKQLNKKFTKHCKSRGLVVTCQLPSLITPYIQHYDFKITFADFDEYEPNLQTLISSMQKSGCNIMYYDSNRHQNPLTKKLEFENQYQEITTTALWAKQIVNLDPKANIGIVVPNLTNLRSEITHIFAEVLGNTKNFNISAGINFASLPIVHDALELLKPNETFNLKAISKILLSPYIGEANTEKSKRALFDFQLHQLGQSEFHLTDIEFLAKKYQSDIFSFIKALQKKQEIYTLIQNKKFYNSDWVKIFAQILQSLGWPGESNLTEHESVAVKRFTLLLQEVTTTNLITRKTSYTEALQVLCDLAIHTVFQSESESDAAINILGVLEATGINFEYLWIMGINQENWPTAPNPTPFIPISIQKKFRLPHASAERELYFCEALTKRFKRSAKEVLFSYVKQIDDRVTGPSALIADIPNITLEELNLAIFTSQTKKSYYSKKIEELIDDAFVALTPNEIIYGGSHLIEMQSLCPFRAFAELRLTACGFKQFEPGISKIERGILIHSALENFWQKIKTHQNLCILDHEHLQDLIKKSINYALAKLKLRQPIHKLEQQCLMRLLTRWLEIEKSRSPFEVVALEKNILTNLGSIQIKLRIDRIDRLANGNLLIIDYKTGKKLPVIFDWFGQRPENPQLPLYCIAVNEAQCFAFAQINIESIKLKIICLDELNFGLHTVDKDHFKNDKNWHEFITYWHEILLELAKNFIAGQAYPTPLSSKVCKQCEFGIICRASQTQ